MKKRTGFTLVELMVVIVIIGILATLGLVSYQNAMKRSRDTKRISDLKDIASAQEQFKALNGAYVDIGDASNNCTLSTISDFSVPSDPGSLTYKCHEDATPPSNFCLSAELEASNNGNCKGCSSPAAIDTTGKTHYCVKSKQ